MQARFHVQQFIGFGFHHLGDRNARPLMDDRSDIFHVHHFIELVFAFPDIALLVIFLLQAQASGAKVLGLANAGTDTVNSIKQAAEFGIVKGGQSLAGLLVFLSDIHGLGLDKAQGLIFTETYYWDLNDGTRAFAKRFAAANNGKYYLGRSLPNVPLGDITGFSYTVYTDPANNGVMRSLSLVILLSPTYVGDQLLSALRAVRPSWPSCPVLAGGGCHALCYSG